MYERETIIFFIFSVVAFIEKSIALKFAPLRIRIRTRREEGKADDVLCNQARNTDNLAPTE